MNITKANQTLMDIFFFKGVVGTAINFMYTVIGN